MKKKDRFMKGVVLKGSPNDESATARSNKNNTTQKAVRKRTGKKNKNR